MTNKTLISCCVQIHNYTNNNWHAFDYIDLGLNDLILYDLGLYDLDLLKSRSI